MFPTSAKGQLSFEYLLLFLIFVSLLGISLTVLTDLKNKGDFLISKKKFLFNAQLLSSRIEEVCLTGSGNRRLVNITVPLELSDGRISSDDFEYSFSVECQVESDKVFGEVVVENSGGVIRVI